MSYMKNALLDSLEKAPTIRIGKIVISVLDNETVWIEKDKAEGGAFTSNLVEKTLTTFLLENF